MKLWPFGIYFADFETRMVELIEYAQYSKEQKRVIDLRLQEPPVPYEAIIADLKENMNVTIYPKTLTSIIKRSALGFPWVPAEEKGGAYPYLCPADTDELKRLAHLLCENGEGCIDPQEFLDMARELKLSRLHKACNFLIKCNCPTILASLNKEETEPSRSWINSILEDVSLQFSTPIYVETARADACSLRRLINFYSTHEELIKQCPASLLFGADETMINGKFKGKVLIAQENENTEQTKKKKVVRKMFKIPHITAVCCHSANGAKLPPMIILPDTKHLPPELYEFDENGTAWFCSSPSGWMCRDLFLIWSIHFINWLSIYRKTLSVTIRDKRALLILDGHSSRECPLALLLLRNARVDVLVLPGHTTHVTQMFDVVLAAPLKCEYARLLAKQMKDNGIKRGDKSQSALKRRLAIYCFLSAWDKVCTTHHCTKAAAVCGYKPFKEDAIASSIYVREFSEAEERDYQERLMRRNRYDINAKLITDPAVLDQIIAMVGKSTHLQHLCEPIGTNYSMFCKQTCHRKLSNNCYFLGRLPPFIDSMGNVHTFPEPSD